MIYLLSWSGRGYLGFLSIFLAVAVAVGIGAFFERGWILFFGIGWILASAMCFGLQQKSEAGGKGMDRFCGFSLNAWGGIYLAFGIFFTVIGAVGWRVGM